MNIEIKYWIEYRIEWFLGPIQRLIESSKSIEHPQNYLIWTGWSRVNLQQKAEPCDNKDGQ